MKKAIGMVLVVCLCAGLFAGCSAKTVPGEETRSIVGFYFDTVVTINVCSRDETVLQEALEQCARYEQLLSKTVEGSDVWNINHANGQPVQVKKETMEILQCAQQIAQRTHGAFDITIAPAASLWDFTSSEAVLPDAQTLAQAAALTDYTLLELNQPECTVTLPAGHRIDLGGIAKGYIADQVGKFLQEKGVKSGILNFGGNVVLLGEKADGTPWQVGIQDPNGDTGEYLGVLSQEGGTVVTSGIYERGFTLDGTRYHHILDPETGWPVQNELASVTISCQSSMQADALSTACFVLGLEKGMALVQEQPGVEAVFVTRQGEVWATDGAKAWLNLSGSNKTVAPA